MYADDILIGRIRAMGKASDELEASENVYYNLDASTKAIYSSIFNEKQGTIAEREAQAHSDSRMTCHMTALSAARTDWNKKRRNYEITMKAYDAAHLTFKMQGDQIKRQ